MEICVWRREKLIMNVALKGQETSKCIYNT